MQSVPGIDRGQNITIKNLIQNDKNAIYFKI